MADTSKIYPRYAVFEHHYQSQHNLGKSVTPASLVQATGRSAQEAAEWLFRVKIPGMSPEEQGTELNPWENYLYRDYHDQIM